MDAHVDAALVVAARDGDRDAVARLIAEHLPLVYNVAGRALDGHPDVDDVVQETMLRAVQALPSLREPERFRSWLVAIALRQVQDRHRTRRAAPPALADVAEPADPDAEFADDAVDRLALARERRVLVAAGGWLDDEDRRVLALWWQELCGGLNRADVAGALGLTVAHAGVRIQRMRAHLLRARAVLAAWQARPRCPELAAAGRGWDGAAEPRWQKRLHRHVRDCARCQAASLPPVGPEATLAGLGLLPVPADLLRELLSEFADVATGTALAGAGTGAGPAIASAKAAGAASAKAAVGAHAAGGMSAPGAGPGWWSRVGEALTGKPAVITTAAGAAVAIAAAVVLLPDRSPIAPPAVAAPPSAVTAGPSTVPPSASPSPSAAVVRTQIFLSPSGSDGGDGSARRPYASLAKAVSVVRPGQTIVARGGVYRPTRAVEISTDGTADRRITLTNAPGEQPVFDAAGIPAGDWFITQTADYWTVRGLEIRNAPGHPYVCRACRFGVFSRLSVHDSGGTGLLLRDPGTEGNQVLDGDFYRNRDRGGADGVSFKYGSGRGNVVRGCRFWGNVDDGLDLHEFADPVTVERSWAYGNGVDHWRDPDLAVPGAGNGFRLGGGNPAPAVAHVVTGSAAWDNTGYGFTESANRGRLRLTGNTAYRNGKDGFAFFYSASVFERNLALGNARDAVLADAAAEDGNSWNQPGWTTDALVERDPGTAQGARGDDGRLPATAFLTHDRDPAVGAPMAG